MAFLPAALEGHTNAASDAVYSPNGKLIATSSFDGTLKIWDAATGERIHSYLDNEEAVLDLVYHPDGNSFYSISFAQDLTRWEVHPEIFVMKYYDKAYLEEVSGDPIFEPKRRGEAKKDYMARQEEAEIKKTEILERYYKQYLSERDW